MALSRQDKLDAQAIFAAGDACEHCGGIHKRACPRVKRQVWLRTGAGAGERTEVEYWGQYPHDGIIWPEDAYDPEDNAEDANGR